MRLARWDPFWTTTTRWDPVQELEAMTERMNRLMGRAAVPTGAEEALVTAEWTPIVDIQETDKEYLIKAELPEVKKDDVKVSIKDGVLTLEGERRQEKEEKGKKFHRIERSFGKFVRCFTMPEDADEKSVQADFKDGLLNVHLGKSEVVKPKAIEVKVA
jgi:HSP20 family protein